MPLLCLVTAVLVPAALPLRKPAAELAGEREYEWRQEGSELAFPDSVSAVGRTEGRHGADAIIEGRRRARARQASGIAGRRAWLDLEDLEDLEDDEPGRGRWRDPTRRW